MGAKSDKKDKSSKKRHLLVEEPLVNDQTYNVTTVKKKKKKSREENSKDTFCEVDSSPVAEETHLKKRKKAKSTKIRKADVKSSDVEKEMETDIAVFGKRKKKKKRKEKIGIENKTSTLDDQAMHEQLAQPEKEATSDMESSKSKKKKKKKLVCSHEDESKSLRHDENIEDEENAMSSKKKKKKRKHERTNDDETASFEVVCSLPKKKRVVEVPNEARIPNENDTDLCSNGQSNQSECLPSKKHKKSKKPKREIKKKEADHDISDDDKIMSKKSRSDEAKKSGSEDSGKSKEDEPSPGCQEVSQTNSTRGQWQGDLFDSTDRQNKFLRLLGGMKDSSKVQTQNGSTKPKILFGASKTGEKKKGGLFGSLTSKMGSGSHSFANAALSRSDAANLNQKLEDQYNKALDFKLKSTKGIGLGFVPDPSEGKKFHIDVNKFNSIKFDD